MNKSIKGAGRKPAPKRIIKASKGGRTVRAPEARMTPEDLAALESILRKRGISFGDWLHETITTRDRNTLNFQLDKADDYINVLRAWLAANAPTPTQGETESKK